MSIIITCAGSSIINGIYDEASGGSYIKRNDIVTLSYVTDRWILEDNIDQYYYSIQEFNSNPYSINNWVVAGGGESPVPSIEVLTLSTCSVLIVTGSPETNANNGVYNLTYTEDVIPKPFYVNSLNGTYTIEQVSLDEGQREWALLGAGEITYASITVPDEEPPLGVLSSVSSGSANAGNISFSSNCSIYNCESPSSNNGSSHFIYKKNNDFFIRKSGNAFLIRSISESSVSELIDTGLAFYVDAANGSSYSGPSTTWANLVAPSNNLTLGRNDMYVSDGGGALYVQGTYADISDTNYNDYLDFGTDSFSIELWTMNTGGQQGFEYQAILNIGTYTDGILLRYIKNISYGVDSLYIAGSYYDWDPQFTMPEDTWVHMVIVKSSTNVKFYVNGVQIINATAPSIVSPSAGILIGRSAHAIQEEYYGYISTLRIYRNYALTSADVTQNFNATKNRYGL